jgi:hypothetical protein
MTEREKIIVNINENKIKTRIKYSHHLLGKHAKCSNISHSNVNVGKSDPTVSRDGINPFLPDNPTRARCRLLDKMTGKPSVLSNHSTSSNFI